MYVSMGSATGVGVRCCSYTHKQIIRARAILKMMAARILLMMLLTASLNHGNNINRAYSLIVVTATKAFGVF